MRLLFLLLFLAKYIECFTSKPLCNGVVFDGVYYDKESIMRVYKAGLGNSYNLVWHNRSGSLFFSNTVHFGTFELQQLMVCHLEDGHHSTCNNIPRPINGLAVAIDRKFQAVFLGGLGGIYRYNFDTRDTVSFAEPTKTVLEIFIGKHFYYVAYPTMMLMRYHAGKSKSAGIEYPVEHFYGSGEEMYFSNRSGIFYKVNEKATSQLLNNRIEVRQITEDSHGVIYFCAKDGIYQLDKRKHSLKKVANIDQAYGLTFRPIYSTKYEKFIDKVIFSDKTGIYKLVQPRYGQYCLENQATLREKQKKHSESKSINFEFTILT